MIAPRNEMSRLESQASDRPVKREYESPHLKQVGTLEEITRGSLLAAATDNMATTQSGG